MLGVGGEEWLAEHRGLSGQWNFAVWYSNVRYMLYIGLNPQNTYITHKNTTPRVYPNVNYGPWMIRMCQCRFLNHNKRTSPVWCVDSGGGCASAGAGSQMELYGLSIQFCCGPKTTLKNSLLI